MLQRLVTPHTSQTGAVAFTPTIAATALRVALTAQRCLLGVVGLSISVRTSAGRLDPKLPAIAKKDPADSVGRVEGWFFGVQNSPSIARTIAPQCSSMGALLHGDQPFSRCMSRLQKPDLMIVRFKTTMSYHH
jgi:hypothetical protein